MAGRSPRGRGRRARGAAAVAAPPPRRAPCHGPRGTRAARASSWLSPPPRAPRAGRARHCEASGEGDVALDDLLAVQADPNATRLRAAVAVDCHKMDQRVRREQLSGLRGSSATDPPRTRGAGDMRLPLSQFTPAHALVDIPPVAGDHPGRPSRWAWNFISRGRSATASWAPIRPAVAGVPLRCVPPTKIGSRITGTPRSVVADLDPDPRLFEPQRAGVAQGRCPGT